MEKTQPFTASTYKNCSAQDRSCSFFQIAGEELAPDKVDELGLCAEHGNEGRCETQGARADVEQPGHPALVTAEPHLWESSDPCTGEVDQQQGWWGQQAWQGSVGAVSEEVVDVVGAVSYPDAHVEAVGKDEAHTAIPVGQEIRDAQKY